MNSYKPCSLHANGHYENCKDCEIDALRDLLRQVANSFAFREVACDPAAVMVRLKADLWRQIEPLRMTNKKEG